MKRVIAALIACFSISAQASLIPVDLSGGVEYNGQFTSGAFTTNSDNTVLTMNGDNWIAFQGPFVVDTNTVVNVSFSSTNVREIHGFGFDNDLSFNFSQQTQRVFQLAGSQRNFGIQDFRTYTGSGVETFSIPIGQFFTGTFTYILFINDDDAAGEANSVFGLEFTESGLAAERMAAQVSAPSHLAMLALGIAGMCFRSRRSK
jgi:hypothetical protein